MGKVRYGGERTIDFVINVKYQFPYGNCKNVVTETCNKIEEKSYQFPYGKGNVTGKSIYIARMK